MPERGRSLLSPGMEGTRDFHGEQANAKEGARSSPLKETPSLFGALESPQSRGSLNSGYVINRGEQTSLAVVQSLTCLGVGYRLCSIDELAS